MRALKEVEIQAATTIRVLLVEDNADDASLAEEMLAEATDVLFDFTHVEWMDLALQKLGERSFDVVLLDLSLPDAHGLESISQLRAVSPDIPLVVLSGLADESLAIQALREGAQDYLVKGQTSSHLIIRSIRYALERKRTEDRLAYLANFDQLTGLTNRSLFRDRLGRALERAKRHVLPVYVLYLDLDGFKETNDTRGHAVGDRLLKAVGKRLQSCLRTVDTVARLGGDEFSAVLEGVQRADDAVTIAIKLLEVIAKPFELEDLEIFVTASIGLAAYPYDAGDIEALLKCADSAMYGAKAQGGNALQVYCAGTDPQVAGRGALANDLRRALARSEFCLYYQPQIDLLTGRTIGLEALIRWQHSERGLLSPGSFIHAAEENGLIVQIGRWVLQFACAQYRIWLDQGLLPERAAVNLSPRQFRDRELIDTVAHALAINNLPPQHLEVELTENFLLENTRERISTLSELKAMGLRVSLDDFGTGYSSLRYLKVLPIDRLKIDQSFVGGLTTIPKDEAIVSTIINLARSLNLEVLAEGVETEAQMAFLGDHGCEAIQGYLISPPLNVEAMTQWLKDEPLSHLMAIS